MAFFERVIDNSGDEHHETPCDTSGTWWTRRNPMGWGSNNARTVRETRPTMHGSRAERKLAGGTGALIRQNGGRVRVSGEKPGRGRN